MNNPISDKEIEDALAERELFIAVTAMLRMTEAVVELCSQHEDAHNNVSVTALLNRMTVVIRNTGDKAKGEEMFLALALKDSEREDYALEMAHRILSVVCKRTYTMEDHHVPLPRVIQDVVGDIENRLAERG